MPVVSAEDSIGMPFYQVFKSAGRLVDDLHIVTVSHDYQIWGLIIFSYAFAIFDIDDFIVVTYNHSLELYSIFLCFYHRNILLC